MVGLCAAASSAAALRSDRLAAPPATVGGDEQLGLRVVDPARQCLRAEAAEDDRMRGADPGAGEHRDRELRDHGHVDGDPVARLDAQLDERVRGLLDLAQQVGIGDRAGVAGLTDPVIGDLVAKPVARHGGRGSCRLTFSFPPRNHLANGRSHSSVVSNGVFQVSRSRQASPRRPRSRPRPPHRVPAGVRLRRERRVRWEAAPSPMRFSISGPWSGSCVSVADGTAGVLRLWSASLGRCYQALSG